MLREELQEKPVVFRALRWGVVVSVTTVPREGWGVPKMRHLVLYKLAGFSRSDYVPWPRKTRGAMRHTVFSKKWKNDHFWPFFDQKCAQKCRKMHFFAHFSHAEVHPRFSSRTRQNSGCRPTPRSPKNLKFFGVKKRRDVLSLIPWEKKFIFFKKIFIYKYFYKKK